jgi:hypothetical protein
MEEIPARLEWNVEGAKADTVVATREKTANFMLKNTSE